MTLAKIEAALPAESTKPLPANDAESLPAADVRWLLGELEKGKKIRINCGAKYSNPAGADRFYRGGSCYPVKTTFAVENADSYRVLRIFDENDFVASYRVPLPKRMYRVELRFLETRKEDLGRIDVRLQGLRMKPESRNIQEISFEGIEVGVIETRRFELEVKSGLLDITFDCSEQAVNLAALEIEQL